MAPIQLKGMTWDHPRGYDPLVACSRLWAERTGVEIAWDRRSLQDFESFPVEALARAYDLIIIDHPHVGQVTAEGCLVPFDEGRTGIASIAKGSVGPSFESYRWAGRLWALPVDTAAQVQAFRPDLIGVAPSDWREVLELARDGRVLLPLRPPHSLMSLYTLCGQLGRSGEVDGPALFDPEVGARAYDRLAELAALADPASFGMDPIAVLERMGEAGGRAAVSPLIYGYVSYSQPGFRPSLVRFADLAAVEGRGPVGSAIGGTGLAVSAYGAHREAAADFAVWVAGGEVQRGLYAQAGGQPAHADAWEDPAVNAVTADFYRATRATLERSWLRPRHDGYMPFQHAASERVNTALQTREAGAALIADLNRLFAQSLPAMSGPA
jgi:multiple sugar transport system substrate-binding protein